MVASSMSLTGESGAELASLEWLALHHRVKEKERAQLLARLDIRTGDRVLDLGCGPGFWSNMIAEIVGLSGAVLGVDFADGLLHHAAAGAAVACPDHDISFHCLDFNDIDGTLGEFDVVFFSNCFSYVSDPGAMLQQMAGLVRPGGRVIARNWDGGVFVLNPIPEIVLARMHLLLAKVFDGRRSNPYFDNYFGRKLPGVFRRHGFDKIVTKTQIIERAGPADADLSAYIEANGTWWGDTVSHLMTGVEQEEWRRFFDPESSDYICTSNDFYYCMIEPAVTGYV